MEFHKLFETEAEKEEPIEKETVSNCMWEETHEQMQEWYESIKRKIEKY